MNKTNTEPTPQPNAMEVPKAVTPSHIGQVALAETSAADYLQQQEAIGMSLALKGVVDTVGYQINRAGEILPVDYGSLRRAYLYDPVSGALNVVSDTYAGEDGGTTGTVITVSESVPTDQADKTNGLSKLYIGTNGGNHVIEHNKGEGENEVGASIDAVGVEEWNTRLFTSVPITAEVHATGMQARESGADQAVVQAANAQLNEAAARAQAELTEHGVVLS